MNENELRYLVQRLTKMEKQLEAALEVLGEIAVTVCPGNVVDLDPAFDIDNARTQPAIDVRKIVEEGSPTRKLGETPPPSDLNVRTPHDGDFRADWLRSKEREGK